jgi:hypothetical protein
MKKYLLILLLPLLLGVNTFSGSVLKGASCGAVAATCSASTDYVGNKGEGTVGSYSFAYQYIDCWAYTPTCSGNVNTAYVYHRGTETDKIRVSLYSKSTTAPAAADELLVQSSAELTSSTDKEWASGAMGSYTVSSSTTYWMCVLVTSNIGAGWPTYYANGDSNRYEKNISSSTLPTNLAADYTGPTDDRIPSVYISIGE